MALMEKVGNLLQNKLLLYYLSDLGSALGGEGSVGRQLGETNKQVIRTQNYQQMLQKMLAGGGKMTIDKDTVSIKGPTSMLGEGGSKETTGVKSGLGTVLGGGGLWPGEAPTAPVAPAKPSTNLYTPPGAQEEFKKLLNPSASPTGTDLADLIGLTPEDLTNAMQLKLSQEEIGRKTYKDLVDMVQAQQLLGIRGKQAETQANIDRRPAAVQTYEYAKGQGFKGSLKEFQEAAKTTHMKDYEAAVADGYEGNFYDFIHSLAKARGINLGELVAKKTAESELKGEAYFTDPKGLSKDIDSYLSDTMIMSEIGSADNPERVKAEKTASFIESQIIASGGKIKNVKMDGRTRVWTVEWKSGRTSEVRHAF